MRHLDRRSALVLGLAAPLLARGAAAQGAASPEQRLRERGIELPRVAPIRNAPITLFRRSGKLVFLSGMGPRRPDGSFATGKVGREVTTEEAYQHARLTGLAMLAVMRDVVGGSLDDVAGVLKVFGMVNATPEFTEHPRVINGCSELFVEVFGEERGRHARSAVGLASLPGGWTVEIEAIFEAA